GFARVGLVPGETRTVRLDLPARRLAYYDVDRAGWVVEAIGYVAYAGGSSREKDLLSARFRIAEISDSASVSEARATTASGRHSSAP
ncbi:MAG: fibronectin type III-like domain-contianing protein, partial [Anaerolineae bacterium]